MSEAWRCPNCHGPVDHGGYYSPPDDEAAEQRDAARAEAAALRGVLARIAEETWDNVREFEDVTDVARTALATDAGKAALDAVRLAQRALEQAVNHFIVPNPDPTLTFRGAQEALAALRSVWSEP